MELNQELSQIINRITTSRNSNQQHTTTTQNLYKCNLCKDTTFIEDNGTYTRCQCYKVDKAKALMTRSGLKPDQQQMTLSNYEVYNQTTLKAKEICKEYIKSFLSTKDKSLLLSGQPGAGKTHLIVSIATNLINRGIAAVYMPYLETMQLLKQNAIYEEEYEKLKQQYTKAELLVIDDLFKDKVKNGQFIKDKYGNIASLTEADMKHIYPIINYRYLNNLPTVISTECTPHMLMELDEALAGRILERCGKYITVFKGSEFNYRLRNFR